MKETTKKEIETRLYNTYNIPIEQYQNIIYPKDFYKKDSIQIIKLNMKLKEDEIALLVQVNGYREYLNFVPPWDLSLNCGV